MWLDSSHRLSAKSSAGGNRLNTEECGKKLPDEVQKVALPRALSSDNERYAAKNYNSPLAKFGIDSNDDGKHQLSPKRGQKR